MLVVARQNGTWSDPVFYDVGGIRLGAQFGAEEARIAMPLMTDCAVDRFKQQNNFSLNADAGLTVTDYSARGPGSADGRCGAVVGYRGRVCWAFARRDRREL